MTLFRVEQFFVRRVQADRRPRLQKHNFEKCWCFELGSKLQFQIPWNATNQIHNGRRVAHDEHLNQV
jgi:hypothetical protein